MLEMDYAKLSDVSAARILSDERTEFAVSTVRRHRMKCRKVAVKDLKRRLEDVVGVAGIHIDGKRLIKLKKKHEREECLVVMLYGKQFVCNLLLLGAFGLL